MRATIGIKNCKIQWVQFPPALPPRRPQLPTAHVIFYSSLENEIQFLFEPDEQDDLRRKIEVAYQGTQIPVCYDGGDDDQYWTAQNAWVACRQLGYHGGRSIAYESEHDGLIVKDVRCGQGKFYTS